VFAACTHPVLSGPAVERIAKSKIEEVVVSDSVPLNEAAQKLPKITVLSVAELVGARDSVDSRRDFDQRTIHLFIYLVANWLRRRNGYKLAVKEGEEGRTYGVMETFTIEGKVREGTRQGSRAAHAVDGNGPAILYGGQGFDFAFREREAGGAILRSETGHNTIFTVRVADGAAEKAMMKDWQVDPVRALLHVDLLRIAMDVRMRVMVPVHTFGEPQGVKMQGGVFETVTREVEIECLPGGHS
jgi:ribosomal protein L25 (general stress protein Ctc)